LVIYGSICAALLIGGLAYITPSLINTTSAAHLSDARSLILSMGFASCLAMVMLVFSGIITGSGRFDALNLVDGLSDVVVVASIIACMLFGFGLKSMGACVFLREAVNAVAKYHCARRVSPQLHVRPRWFDGATFAQIFRFSGKSFVDTLSKLLQYQAAPLAIAAFIGPASLAVYSRPRALILITTRFVMGFARVLVPAAAAFHDNRDHRLAELLVQSTKYAMFLSLPPALVMLLFGRSILRLWMGHSVY